jgi:hypothetical protein
VAFVGAQVPSIAVTPLGQQVRLDQMVDLPLHRARRQPGEPHQFAEIELALGEEMCSCQDGPAPPRGNQRITDSSLVATFAYNCMLIADKRQGGRGYSDLADFSEPREQRLDILPRHWTS